MQQALDAGDTADKTASSHHAVTPRPAAPLTGILYDGDGARMSPVAARKRAGAVYRYYVSQSLLTGRKAATSASRRVNATLLEQQVYDLLQRVGLLSTDATEPDWAAARQVVRRVTVDGNQVTLVLAVPIKLLGLVDDLATLRARLGDTVVDVEVDNRTVTLVAALIRSRRSGGMAALGPAGQNAVVTIERDPVLASALIRAEAWKRRLLNGQVPHLEAIAQEENLTSPYVARMARLAFLDPALKRQILEGKQPAGLTLQRLMTSPIPLAWSEQQALYRG